MNIFSIDKFLNKKYVFINEPLRLIKGDYEDALSVFVEKFSLYPNVVSIYKFGAVSSIGISDLDFIVILQDRPLAQDSKFLAYHGFSKKEIYIYNNTPPMYMSDDIFKHFQQIFPLKGLQLLYGKEIEQNNEPDKDAFDILTLIELLSMFYPKVFLELLYSGNFNTRRALLLLNALKFPIKLAAQFIEVSPHWTQYENKVTELRTKWFDMDNAKYPLLVSLVYEAVNVSLELIDKVKVFLMQHSLVMTNQENSHEVIGSLQNGRTLFIRNFSPERALNIILEKHLSRNYPKRFSLVLPDIFLLPLIAYMEQSGALSDHLKKHLKIAEAFQGSLSCKSEADKRIAVLNSLMSFIEKNKVFPNGIHIYYGYWPKVGLKNRIIQRLVNTGL